MRYRELLELYSQDNSRLLHYLKDGEFDAYSAWWNVCDTIFKDAKYKRAMSRVLGRKIASRDDIEDEEPDIFYKLPKDIQAEIGEKVTDWLMQHSPEEAPTAAHVSLQSKKPLPRLTWLVHFTDDPDSIATEGFTKGVADISKLGLTNYVGDHEKKYGGYNFAFIADSRDALNASNYHHGDPKYGKHAVMFQNSGIHVIHFGDQEDQIIFWGPEVKPRDLVVLHNNEGDWSAMARTFYYKRGEPSFDKAVYTPGFDEKNKNDRRSSFEKCSQWVIDNFQQYRKALTGF